MVDETVHFVHTHTPTGVHEVSSVVDLHRSELRRLTFSGFLTIYWATIANLCMTRLQLMRKMSKKLTHVFSHVLVSK